MSADVFHAVADPNRRRLIELLGRRERSVGDLVDELRLSYSAVSQHLAVLRRAGLVTRRALGVQRLYRLEPAPLRELHAWSQRYEKFWTRRLDRLGRYLEEET